MKPMTDLVPQALALLKAPLQRALLHFGFGTKPIAKGPPRTTRQRAQALVSAVDGGGVPLNPALVNAIARDLGLEVSTHAPVEDTVARIRLALQRMRD